MKTSPLKLAILFLSITFLLTFTLGCDKKPKNMPRVNKTGQKVRPARKSITQGSAQKKTLPAKQTGQQLGQETDNPDQTPTPVPEGDASSVKKKKKIQKKQPSSGP